MEPVSSRLHGIERLVPDHELREKEASGIEAFKLHLERYEFALRCIAGRTLVGDIACGSGYGSYVLGDDPARQLIGVDLSPDAIEYATNRYKRDNIAFVCADALQFAFERPFDAIISFETIEHVPRPLQLVHHLTNLIRPGGLLIASVPITPSMDANPFHLHDFTESSFLRLFPPQLRRIESFYQTQPFDPINVTTRAEKRLVDLRPNLLNYYLLHPNKAFRRIWSTLRDGFNNKYLSVVMEKE